LTKTTVNSPGGKRLIGRCVRVSLIEDSPLQAAMSFFMYGY